MQNWTLIPPFPQKKSDNNRYLIFFYNASTVRVRNDSRALRTYSLIISCGRVDEFANSRVSSGNFANAVASSQAMPILT